eukprot:354493-Chlamydomonas_euryale.AAC.2
MKRRFKSSWPFGGLAGALWGERLRLGPGCAACGHHGTRGLGDGLLRVDSRRITLPRFARARG